MIIFLTFFRRVSKTWRQCSNVVLSATPILTAPYLYHDAFDLKATGFEINIAGLFVGCSYLDVPSNRAVSVILAGNLQSWTISIYSADRECKLLHKLNVPDDPASVNQVIAEQLQIEPFNDGSMLRVFGAGDRGILLTEFRTDSPKAVKVLGDGNAVTLCLSLCPYSFSVFRSSTVFVPFSLIVFTMFSLIAGLADWYQLIYPNSNIIKEYRQQVLYVNDEDTAIVRDEVLSSQSNLFAAGRLVKEGICPSVTLVLLDRNWIVTKSDNKFVYLDTRTLRTCESQLHMEPVLSIPACLLSLSVKALLFLSCSFDSL